MYTVYVYACAYTWEGKFPHTDCFLKNYKLKQRIWTLSSSISSDTSFLSWLNSSSCLFSH